MVPEEIYLSIPGFEAGERGGPSSIGGAQAPSRGRTGQEVSVGARLPGGRGVTFRTSASKMPQRVWPFQVGSPENYGQGVVGRKRTQWPCKETLTLPAESIAE